MHKIDPNTLKNLLIDKSMTDLQAAVCLGVSETTIFRRRVELGISPKPKHVLKEFSDQEEEQLLKMYSRGCSDYEAASIMCVGRDRLRRWRNEKRISSKRPTKMAHDFFRSIPHSFNILAEDKKELLIDYAFKYYRSRGFPYLVLDNCSLEKKAHQVINTEPIINGDIIGHNTYGIDFCEHFMPHMYEARRYDGISPYERWNDDELLKKLLYNRFKYAPKFNNSSIRRGLKIAGSVSNFKPTVAKYIYQRYVPESGTAYDFSAGYGGRLLGFMSCGRNKKYIGIEPMSKSIDGLRSMAQFWSENLYPVDVKIIQGCSEEYRGLESSIDVAFSSPPYYGLEIYSKENTQSFVRYGDYSKWLDEYFRATIGNCYYMLKRGGRFIAVLGNYGRYNILEDATKICADIGLIKELSLKIPLSNIFGKKKNNSNYKYETLLIFRK